MHEKHIICSDCGKIYHLKTKIFRCRCGGSLEIIFDYKKLKKSLPDFQERPFNHARYKEFYPVKTLVSLQEGGTPLIKSKNIGKNLPFDLYFKCESQNPSGSFKDRGSSIEISKALEFNAKKVICASTGNMGASVAAYSGIVNLDCCIFVSRHAPKIKMEQILAYGAKLYHVDADYTQTTKMVEEAYKKFGIYLLGDYLYRREGTKSVGYEILEQIKNPDYIFIPIGNGTLISAVWKACKEFKLLGFSKDLPRLIGLQAETCSPLYNIIKNRSKKCGRTIATAIECGEPLDGKRVLEAVKESKGFLATVTDKEILKARELLAGKEGLFAEPSGAVSLAGFLKYKDKLERGSKVVCLITGHGLKAPLTSVRGKPIEIEIDPDTLNNIFKP